MGTIKKTDSTNCWQGHATSVTLTLCQSRTHPHETVWPLPAHVCFWAYIQAVSLPMVTKAMFVEAKTQEHHMKWKHITARYNQARGEATGTSWVKGSPREVGEQQNEPIVSEIRCGALRHGSGVEHLPHCDQSPDTHPTPTKRNGKTFSFWSRYWRHDCIHLAECILLHSVCMSVYRWVSVCLSVSLYIFCMLYLESIFKLLLIWISLLFLYLYWFRSCEHQQMHG